MRKPSLFLPVIALLLAAMLLIKCAKEYSYEGGLSAQYAIAGSPTECAPAILSGNYVAGVATDTSNYLQVTAAVTLRGFYNISTKPVDGISFSATGNFTDTGKQVIKLASTGIPDYSGSFIVKIPGNNGCYMTLQINNKAASSYVLSGNPGDCSTPVIHGRFIQDKLVSVDDTVVLGVKVVTPGTYRIKTDTANGVSFSALGYFFKTGNQTVTLTGTGTPDQPGRFYFNVHADSAECNFSISVKPIFPAVYVLEYGYDTVCQYDTARGSYVSGVQLNATNTLTFSVYATAVGNYSVYTDKVNGMVFGTSGKFSLLGEQRMVLTGSGMPSAPGTFIFRPFIIGPSPLGGNFCNFSVKVQ